MLLANCFERVVHDHGFKNNDPSLFIIDLEILSSLLYEDEDYTGNWTYFFI